MALNNPWVGYITRSYEQIKESLLSRLSIKAPEITDHSESNILVIILSMFAGVAEMLSLYIDNMAREAFIATARRFNSMVKLVKLLDYRVKAATAASVDVLFTFNAATSGSGTILKDTAVKTGSNITFLSTQDVAVGTGVLSIFVPCKQLTHVVSQILGVTSGAANQAVVIGTNYVHDSMSIIIQSQTWTLVRTLGLSTPTDKHFIVEINTDGSAYIIFGDGTNGLIPPVAQNIICTYDTTLGSLGNVEKNTITTLVSVVTLPGVTTTTVNNNSAASSGSGYETVERLRVSAPLSIRTLERAVTRQDYIDTARLAPGVGKAEINFSCGKSLDVYIAPLGGGIAATALLTDTTTFFDGRRMVTTFVNVIAAGESRLKIAANVTARFRENATATKTDVENALVTFGSFDNQNINRKVRTSDIVALIDNLLRVDSVDLVGLSTIPYARPVNHTTQLLWTRETLATSIAKVQWKLEYTLTGVRIFRNGIFTTTVPLATEYIDPQGATKFTVTFGPYSDGMEWTFVTYPFLSNIELDDYTMPKVEVGDLTITVTEQLSQPI